MPDKVREQLLRETDWPALLELYSHGARPSPHKPAVHRNNLASALKAEEGKPWEGCAMGWGGVHREGCGMFQELRGAQPARSVAVAPAELERRQGTDLADQVQDLGLNLLESTFEGRGSVIRFYLES